MILLASLHFEERIASQQERLNEPRGTSVKFLESYEVIALIVFGPSGSVSFEWPRHCSGTVVLKSALRRSGCEEDGRPVRWSKVLLVSCLPLLGLARVDIDGRAVGSYTRDRKHLLYKPWRFAACSPSLFDFDPGERACFGVAECWSGGQRKRHARMLFSGMGSLHTMNWTTGRLLF